MNEAWVAIFGTNALSISAGELGARPGLGRHQLLIPIDIRPTNEAAYGHSYSFSGSLSATDLGAGTGYLGRFNQTSPRQLVANGLATEYLTVDIDPRQIDAIERRRNGGFSLQLDLEVRADEGRVWGSTQLLNHPVSRDTWLRALDQIAYQKTILLELPVPDPQTAPRLTKAIEYFANAQRRILEGENRLAVEALRQALAALIGSDPLDEGSAESANAALKTARIDQADYAGRFELVRRTLKLLSDLGAHPEVAETGPVEARSAVVMVAGLLQWWSAQP